MSQEDREVYLLHGEGEEGWVSPQPARAAIVEALTDATDLSAEEIGELDAYVEVGDLRDLLGGDDGTLSFGVEDHEVTVDSTGSVTVA